MFGLSAGDARSAELLYLATVDKWSGSWVCMKVLAEIYRQAGLQMQVLPMPILRAHLMAVSGRVDGELCRIYGYEAPELVRVEPGYYRISILAYSMRARNVEVRKPADLLKYSLGTIRGVHYSDGLTKDHPAVTRAINSEQMFRMLQAGRVDLVLEASGTAQTSLDKLNMSAREVVASPELVGFDLFNFLHKRHQGLVPRISEAIRRVKASGELERLTARYEAAVAGVDMETFSTSPQVLDRLEAASAPSP